MHPHPLADLLPLLEGAAWQEFMDSVRDHGQIDPIVTHEGMILDGRNRYRACRELGLEPIAKAYEGCDPLGFVIASNVHRRHLTTAQRAAIAAEVANMENGTNQYTKKVGVQNCTPISVSLEKAAQMMNVSRRAVASAKKRMHEDAAAHQAVKAGQKVTTPSPRQTEEQLAEASLRIQRMALDRGISMMHIGREVSKAVRIATGQKLLRKVDVDDPAVARMVGRVLDEFVGKPLDERYQEHRAEVATLPETAQQKLARLTAKEIEHRLAMFEQEVRERAREQLPEEVKALREAKDRANAEFKMYASMRKGIAAQLSETDYRFLLQVLHPDRAPEAAREKFARAFDIVRKFDSYIEAFKR